MKQKYWIELYQNFPDRWSWMIKCINGRKKAVNYGEYTKRSLCLNDARAFAEYAGLEVR